MVKYSSHTFRWFPDSMWLLGYAPTHFDDNASVSQCRGRTAKEISVLILEQETKPLGCTHLEHANYLGREFQRAEFSLVSGQDYIQD